MNGTTTEANAAMRFTPPMITKASTMTVATPMTHGETPHAPLIADAIEFACTPGSRTPHASIVTAAKTSPYTLKALAARVWAIARLR